MTNNNQASLPSSWSLTKLGEITEINPKLATELPSELEISFIPMRCVAEMSGEMDLSIIRHYKEVRTGYTHFQNGDVIFAKITPCMENGKVAVVNKLKNGIGFGSTEFHVIRLLAQMPSSLLFFFLIQESMRGDAQRHMTGTAGQLRVPVKYLSEVLFPLPPLPEQHRIVAKIEEFFTRLDAGVEALTGAKLQLRRYRQSILKSAFEGKLTADWREAHKGEMEPASFLLEKIQAGRVKSSKHKELPLPDTSDLSKLPDGWEWARVSDIGQIETGTTPTKSKPEYYGKEYTFYKPTDLNAGYFVRDSQDGLSLQGIKKARLLPPNSILVTCIGATIGKTGFIRQEGASNQQINAIITDKSISPEYIYFICISPYFQKSIMDNASSTTLPILNKGKFEVLSLPVPPLEEQRKIVEEIERCLSVADNIEATIEQTLKQGERLRQSILKNAFEGKLVPQDPNDEPADKLLERIKAEKTRQRASVMTPRGRIKMYPSHGRLM